LKRSTAADIQRGLLFGIPDGQSGIPGVAIGITVLKYVNEGSLKLAASSLPYGMRLIGLVEFETDEDQDLYAVRGYGGQ